MTQTTLTVDVHLRPQDLVREMHDDVRRGLTSSPKVIQPKWFYDEQGSRLFDQITRLPEYYPTRREREILTTRAAEIARTCGAETLVELGSGTSEKTRLLLDALASEGTLRCFAPLDVSEEVLREAAEAISDGYERVDVHAVVGDFEHHLHLLPEGGRRLVAFLGGTIGNLTPEVRTGFLARIADLLGPDDALLLGCDLVKDAGRLEAAYNDRAGVTAAFNRNLLYRLNRELGADFEPKRFEHVAFFDPDREWIEMHLRSMGDQRVHVEALALDVHFADGESMRTEISAKFRRERMERELADAGLRIERWWTDAQDDFALSLSTLR